MLGNFRITTKLILWFLFLALLPLTIATYISYGNSRGALEKEARTRLFSIADNKANQIRSYLREKEKDITQLSLMSDLRLALEKFRNAYDKSGIFSAEYNVIDEEYRPFLAYYRKAFGYDDMLLVSPEGEVVFSVSKTRFAKLSYKRAPTQNPELRNVFIETTKSPSLEVKVSNFGYDAASNKVVVFIGIPILSSGDYTGALIARMDNEGIAALARDYMGLGKTGETMIAAKMGNDAVVITPLRFDADATLKRRVRLGSDKEPGLQKAVKGGTGSGITTDYRGKETLAIWSYLPSFRLGMVVKMDTNEVFASAETLRMVLSVTGIALLIIVVAVAILIARSISSPIKELTRVSAKITHGDLKERAAIKTRDEIEELALSFNQMTDSLVEAKASVEAEKAKVEEQKGLLEEVNKELDSFVYTASHDLRAPLRAISSFSNFLEEDCKNKLNKQAREHLGEIQKGTNRMNNLIDDLLTLSRISRIKNPYENINMKDLINSVVERVKFDIKKNKVDLKVGGNIPQVYCDRIKMGEVFLNLITNAIKFSSKGNKDRPRVEIGYEDKNGNHRFSVKDNGIGIDPKYHEEIFTIFRRVGAAGEYEGTGAGLAIVKRIIDDHKGKISVRSEPGKGAAFYFTIPKKEKT